MILGLLIPILPLTAALPPPRPAGFRAQTSPLPRPSPTVEQTPGPGKRGPAPSPPPVEDLRRKLEDPDLPPNRRRSLLAAYLAAAPGIPETEGRVLRVRLAVLDLACRRFREALRIFRELANRTPPTEVDVRARCLLGEGQAREGLGQDREAARIYAEVWKRFPGTRYAKAARRRFQGLRIRPAAPGRRLRLPTKGWVSPEGSRNPPSPKDSHLLLVAPRGFEECLTLLGRLGFDPRRPAAWPCRVLLLAPGAEETFLEGFRERGKALGSRLLLLRLPDMTAPALLENGLRFRPQWALLGPGFRIRVLMPSASRIREGLRGPPSGRKE